jgi:hypothetical protein
MEGPISIILGDFKTYVQNARNQCGPFWPWLRSTLETPEINLFLSDHGWEVPWNCCIF